MNFVGNLSLFATGKNLQIDRELTKLVMVRLHSFWLTGAF